jgi:hypothetical protein
VEGHGCGARCGVAIELGGSHAGEGGSNDVVTCCGGAGVTPMEGGLPVNDEKFYDEEIAPALSDLARKCEERGIGFLAMVGYDDAGSVGRTVTLPENVPFMLRLADTLGRCWCEGGAVNVDGFMIALMRHAREHGHSSAVLAQLGVPTTPAAR